MNRKLLIISIAALMAGTMYASAQENQRNQPGAAPEAPKAQPQGKREQAPPTAPNSRAQDRNQGAPTTTTQGPREGGPAERPVEQGKAPAQRREGQDTNRRNEERREGQDNNRRERTQGQNDRERNQRDEGRTQREERREGQENRGNRENERTQGQGPARPGGAVNLSTEQRTKIRERVLVGNRAPRASNINFSINVGTAVPRSVRLVTVPSVIVDIHPAWRGFLYFVYEDQIIVVDPRSHEIVAVLDV